MTKVGKKVSILLLLTYVVSLRQAYCSRAISTCNLYSTGECAQHCGKNPRNGKENCALSCRRHENGTTVKICNQMCDPSDGNTRKCAFHCSASKECVQQCVQGRCKKMVCNKNRGHCEQYCPGGACKRMLCNSENCFQNCRTGGCNMECGHHVKYCEQICPGGNCQMKCAAKTCRAYCPTGTCDLKGPSKKIQTRCDIKDEKQCAQTCDKNGCYCKGHGLNTHCKQACKGEVCHSIACYSKTCRQDCGSNCSLTCSADHCVQECTGSGCTLSCSGHVNTCKQICRGGGCTFYCAAKRCDNECTSSSSCIFNEIGDPEGLHLDAKCDIRHNGQCEPICKDCVHGGKDLKCTGMTGGKCDQKCLGGSCKNVKCNSKNRCVQNCPGGKCGNMDCRSRQCDQRCSGGSCAKMKCTAANCTQVCLGNCDKIVCNSTRCDQYCYLGRCNFECGENTTVCRQTCHSGVCSFKCRGKQCEKNCRAGICFSAVESSSDSSHRGYLYSISFIFIAMYISL